MFRVKFAGVQKLNNLTVYSSFLIMCTLNILNFRTPKIFAVSYLKFKQKGQTLGNFVKMVQKE